MQKNHFWILFICLFSVIIIGFTLFTGIALWEYYRLDSGAKVQNIQWSISSSNEDSFTPIAQYTFSVNGNKFTGKSAWNETYLNQWTAEEAIGKFKKISFRIWYDSSKPEYSSITKIYPTKKMLYSLMLWILGIYFLGLGYFVNRRLF